MGELEGLVDIPEWILGRVRGECEGGGGASTGAV